MIGQIICYGYDHSREKLPEATEAGQIDGPCTYCGSPDHWQPDCPKIAVEVGGDDGRSSDS